MYKIDFYEDVSGYSELKDFLEELDNSHQPSDQVLLRKIFYQISRLRALGPQLREPHSKFLKGLRYPLMELRPIPERIFYATGQVNHYILLHHYLKRQNSTSNREVKKALKFLEDWKRREG
ncbi:type II toxin-antitoxin system RelE/ParE family toxin [Lactiplantibacillus songbeiensis]|uniref:Type II toxin-antitoxin system RelE/ParE family toxin n=1 Tax=Lactiplantibacillus songbeiensis TaxID=2559920 RepID=A0ABW4C2Z0_9LACO|nr:type II toxin-antitoxin system RelE/ParE family toxin [Lactiplantibacillus songbeiensis]